MLAELREAVLDWYAASRRDLPWRPTTDPYAILVSEVMLQQTQVARVVERWERWLERWPTAAAVYGPTPGSVRSSAGQPSRATARAASWSASARRL